VPGNNHRNVRLTWQPDLLIILITEKSERRRLTMNKSRYSKAIILSVLAVLLLCFPYCRKAEAENDWETGANMTSSENTSREYESLWQQVEEHRRNGLPKSALKAVETIYQSARKQQNAGEFVKAIIHKMHYLQQVEEEAFVKVPAALQKEIEESRFPITPVLHSMLAEQLWNYYRQNRYRFMQRTATAPQFKQDDIRTWDLRKIVETVVSHYDLSLQAPEKLKNIKVNVFDTVITKGNTRRIRPSLFDFLAHRAVDFYKDSEAGLLQPKYQFSLNDKIYLSDAKKFAELELSTRDKLSFQFHALKYLQELTIIHLEDKNPAALVDVDLKRLRFVYNAGIISNKEIIYEKILRNMLKMYEGIPAVTEVFHELAELYNGLGAKYKPGGSEDYKWHKKKARELCLEAVKLYPSSIGASFCKSLINQIEAKHLKVTMETALVPDTPSRGLVEYRNIDTAFFKIVKTDIEEIQKFHRMRREQMIAKLIAKPSVKQWNTSMPVDGDYQIHSAEVKLEAFKSGQYALLAANTENFQHKNDIVAYSFFTVSNISYVNRRTDEKGMEFYLLDRETGSPLKDASAQVWFQRYNRSTRQQERFRGKTVEADDNGYFNISFGSLPENHFFLELINGDDRLYLDRGFGLYRPGTPNRQREVTVFFTDRSIYRPGQTVYFKGIMMQTDSRDGENCRILPNASTSVQLLDVNHQEVSRLQLKTNDYGTFSGTFQLPVGRLNGNMQISNASGRVFFSMEEYKRPKFEVSFKPLKESVRLNDTVTVTGEARGYAGFAVDNAEVKYRVVRNVFFPYPWCYWTRYGFRPSSFSAMEIANGFAQTDADGSFKITFDAIPDLSIAKETKPAFIFSVYADVTDLNGETRSSSKKVYIGYTALKLGIDIPESLDKDKTGDGTFTAALSSATLSGDFVPAEGDITIYKLKGPDRIYRSRLWQKPDKFTIPEDQYRNLFPNDLYGDEMALSKREKEKKVFHAAFDTGEVKKARLSGINRWETGQYLVQMNSRDRFGNDVEEIKYFTLYSTRAKRTPFKTLDWFTVPKGFAEPGQKAVILVGSSEQKIRVIYEVEHRGKIVDTRYLSLNNEQKRIEIPIHEEHRGNVGVHLTFVKHNRLVRHHYNISVPWSNKDLDISFGTFRNKLMPGEEEKWQIKIKGPKGEKVAAEMVAALYDASLDAFRTHQWGFNVFPLHHLQHQWDPNNYFSTVVTTFIGHPQKYSITRKKEYDRLNWFGFYPIMEGRRGIKMNALRRRSPSAPMKMEATFTGEPEAEADSALPEQVQVMGRLPVVEKKRNGDQAPPPPPDEEKKAAVPPVQVRTNFNETAFFYPHLNTTPDGEVVVSFTIPEALTRWKMMGFAHTKNLEFGFLSNELVTQKDLMVMPNPPRFLREGDKMEFTAKVVNLSDKELNGSISLQLLDSVTMQPVDSSFNNNIPSQAFTTQKGRSALAKWAIEIPENLDAVTYRLIARAGKFSDGEEKPIPILKNRMLVTESLPLPVRSKQTRSFTFKKFMDASNSNTLKHHRLTLEFTSNPVWYAVQALPYIMEYPHECMEQVFSRYYGNSMASFIANSNPKIQKVFEIWKQQLGTEGSPNANALLSNLEKNQELKSLLLQETPWVLNGQSESERKKRIALLFDINQMASQLQQALKKLEEGQLPSGAWPWFKGMHENRYITQHIICGFAHLDALKISDSRSHPRLKKMINNALHYMDKEITEDYQRLIRYKANLDKKNLGSIQIHYLYARSYFQDIPLDKRDLKAFDYYINQVKSYWADFHNNKYLQGMMALAMKRYNDSETASGIVESLKEHALYSEEMGMYWKAEHGFFWFRAPIETQALLIEAFSEILNDPESIDQMKTWLLKQKQTQDWRTTKATVEACYALLLRGDDWLKESKPPEITLGKTNPIHIIPGKSTPRSGNSDRINAEAGTGYFKTSWSGNDIQTDMATITIKNNNNVAAWGSLYWQYFENLDKITPAKTPLHLKKQLFIVKPSDTGPIITPIKPGTPIDIGDRIKVRIELRVDRDMEYVHMKDMRASAFEPENVISSYRWQDGFGYYQSTKDASTNFFIDYLPKGTYIFEYPLRTTHNGNFSNGITSIQCMYAPEFTSHSEGIRVTIGKK
jgi:hypothetical protein